MLICIQRDFGANLDQLFLKIPQKRILPPSLPLKSAQCPIEIDYFSKEENVKFSKKSQIGILPNHPEIARYIGVLIKETNINQVLRYNQACCWLLALCGAK